MEKKNDKLKRLRKKLLILATCATVTLTAGCGTSSDKKTSSEFSYYLITINNDNAVIFEMDYVSIVNGTVYNSILNSDFAARGSYVIVSNVDDNSRDYAYSVARDYVGEEGTVSFYDIDTQMKLK